MSKHKNVDYWIIMTKKADAISYAPALYLR